MTSRFLKGRGNRRIRITVAGLGSHASSGQRSELEVGGEGPFLLNDGSGRARRLPPCIQSASAERYRETSDSTDGACRTRERLPVVAHRTEKGDCTRTVPCRLPSLSCRPLGSPFGRGKLVCAQSAFRPGALSGGVEGGELPRPDAFRDRFIPVRCRCRQFRQGPPDGRVRGLAVRLHGLTGAEVTGVADRSLNSVGEPPASAKPLLANSAQLEDEHEES